MSRHISIPAALASIQSDPNIDQKVLAIAYATGKLTQALDEGFSLTNEEKCQLAERAYMAGNHSGRCFLFEERVSALEHLLEKGISVSRLQRLLDIPASFVPMDARTTKDFLLKVDIATFTEVIDLFAFANQEFYREEYSDVGVLAELQEKAAACLAGGRP